MWDLGNTVILIEHDLDIMQAADYIVDIGPDSGKYGGEIIGKGTLKELTNQALSVTGAYLKKPMQGRNQYRRGAGKVIEAKNANLYNLKNIDVSFPIGCLTTVTGVSGSGKSTLVFEVIAAARDQKQNKRNIVCGIEQFDQIITIKQGAINRMKRSNVATYSEVYTEIRKIFGGLEEAASKGLSPKHFSFNIHGARCENCEGLGYLELGQSLTTLSGGEGQRLKLAKELINNKGKQSLHLMDEPTTGLYPIDVENFLILLNHMVNSGNTVIVVEHNQQVIRASDWIIDLGPEGGENGGEVVFA